MVQDGQIDYGEFAAMMRKGNGGIGRRIFQNGIDNAIHGETLDYQNLTRKAIFFSLFIAENCFRRDKTAESRGLSGAIVSSTIHGWPDNKDI